MVEDAQNEDVKQVIRTFDIDKNSDEIYKQIINKFLKPDLADTATFLMIKTENKLKDDIARDIIMKIKSCLFEQCALLCSWNLR